MLVLLFALISGSVALQWIFGTLSHTLANFCVQDLPPPVDKINARFEEWRVDHVASGFVKVFRDKTTNTVMSYLEAQALNYNHTSGTDPTRTWASRTLLSGSQYRQQMWAQDTDLGW
jgi:hypothetical protein